MISFEGAWCASKALAHSCFAVKSSIKCHPQTGQDSACSLDRAAASPLSSMAAHHRRFPRRRMPAFYSDDGARQANHLGLAIRRATLEAPPAMHPAYLPIEAIRGPLHTITLSTGPAARLPNAPPVSSCATCLLARC